MQLSWIALLAAGLCEIGFTTAMKLAGGFTNPRYVVLFLALAALSFALLNRAIVHIPLGTAYAVWTGIGAAGTAIVGMASFGDPISLPRVILLCLLIASVIGLKFVA